MTTLMTGVRPTEIGDDGGQRCGDDRLVQRSEQHPRHDGQKIRLRRCPVSCRAFNATTGDSTAGAVGRVTTLLSATDSRYFDRRTGSTYPRIGHPIPDRSPPEESPSRWWLGLWAATRAVDFAGGSEEGYPGARNSRCRPPGCPRRRAPPPLPVSTSSTIGAATTGGAGDDPWARGWPRQFRLPPNSASPTPCGTPVAAGRMARRVDADPMHSKRLMRALISRGMFRERRGRYELTALAEPLRSDAQYSMVGWARLVGSPAAPGAWERSGRIGENQGARYLRFSGKRRVPRRGRVRVGLQRR